MSQGFPRPIRVLLVDDNLLAVQALERWFGTRPDMECAGSATDADAAVSRAASGNPDVILLDLEMPGIDTLALLPRLIQACPSACVLMLSGYCRESDIARSLDAGAMGYIAKDEPTAEIASLIRRAAAGECVLSPAAERAFHGG